MLPNAILADVVDHDETLTGLRREAMYFGVQAVLQKVAIGMSIIAASALMYAGPAGSITIGSLRSVALVTAIAALASCAVFQAYPLRRR
jgi:GPH family glycoside/pentoside/hexuronide:cation symporter